MLVAIGFVPNCHGLDLEKSGVTLSRGAVDVDDTLRTNVPHIYAIGDVNGKMGLAHVASAQAMVAAEAIASRPTKPLDYENVPRCTHAHPELASVGLTESRSRKQTKGIKMTHQIYIATGCARCHITKRFMKENGMDYEEYDIKADGKDGFAKFYRAHRAEIYRDKDGVEFPVYTDGSVIRQGVSVVIGHLMAGNGLDGFIGRSTLHGEWIDGFNISDGNPSRARDLLEVMAYLKQNGLKILLTTDGRNPEVLKAVHDENLGDRMVMEVKGPADLYEPLTGEPIDPNALKTSISLAAQFPAYQFYSTIAPMISKDGTIRYLTPEEIGETAKTIEKATGSKKHPYELRPFDPAKAVDDRLKNAEPLPASAFFKYRTSARRYMVMTEIAK